MNRINITTCPVCGGTELKQEMTCVDHCATGETFQLWRCAGCGFLFTQDFPADDSMDDYYDAPAYISHTDTWQGIVNTTYHLVRAFMLRRKARLVERAAHLRKGNLLDIGAGTGYFARAMMKRGWQVKAVDSSIAARNYALIHFDHNIEEDSAIAGYADHSFNVVTLWHVMEHIEHLEHIWNEIYRLLDSKGVLVVAAPNHLSADARKYGAYWAAYDVPRHRWHFTPSTIQRLASKYGFIMAAHYPMPFDAFYISMLSEQYMRSDHDMVRGLASGASAWLKSLGRKELSSSMIYVFRKKQQSKP